MVNPGDFYDVETGGDAQFHLDHVSDRTFKLLRRFGYVDLMPPHNDFIIPSNIEEFRTDLASTPPYFTWLIPDVGAHLPAILLHDGLVYGESEEKSYIGPDIERLEADRVFRDAMKALGTGPVRRWLIWAAVALGTSWHWGFRWKALGVLTALVMLALGTLATLDLFDIYDFYPWMGEQTFIRELIGGAIGAFVVPMILCIPWARPWKFPWSSLYFAALIATIAFAFLIHVTIVIAVLLVTYRIFEHLALAIEWRLNLRGIQKTPAPARVYEQHQEGENSSEAPV